MAKTANKSHNEIKELKSRIRDLESENRKLKRRLRQYEKHSSLYEDNREELHQIIENEIGPPKIEEKKLQSCEECGKGQYEEFELLDKVFGTCNTCGARKRLK